MRRHQYSVLAAALVMVVVAAFLFDRFVPATPASSTIETGAETPPESIDALSLPEHGESGAPVTEPLQSAERAADIEPVTGLQIRGVVLDLEGQPVPGIQISACWPLNDEFGDPVRIASGAWTNFFQAVSQGHAHPLWKSIRRHQTRTDRDGAYAFGNLPDIEIQLQAVSDAFELRSDSQHVRAWRVVAVPGDVVNWTATPLHRVRVELGYAGGTHRAGTRIAARRAGEYSGTTYDERGLGEARFLPGLTTFSATNEDFGLLSAPVEFDVTPAGGTVRLELEEVPRLEIEVLFSGALLHTEFELLAQVPEPEGRLTSEGSMLRQAPLARCLIAGVWARPDMPTGEYRVALVCLGREVASAVVKYTGGRQKFVLAVPEPAAADCCVVTSNASPPGDGQALGVRYQYKYAIGAAVVWITPSGQWLIQPPPAEWPELATGLSIGHSAWGNVFVEGNVGPGASIDVQFQRPCTLHFPETDLPYNLRSSMQASLRNKSGQNISLRIGTSTVVQPGSWELHVESSRVPGGAVLRFLALKGGTTESLQIPELVAVKFIFPPSEARGTLEFRGRMAAKEATWNSSQVEYLIPGEYTVEFTPEFGSVYTRTITAAAAMTVDFTR